MPDIVPATAEMLSQFENHPKTVRAIAAVDGDKVLGIAGFYPQNGALVLCAHITDEARRQKRIIVHGIRRLMAMTKGMPLLAHADPDIEGSAVLLKHLGFQPTHDKDIYQWPGPR